MSDDNRLIADKYRAKIGESDGVITIHQGEVQGWSNELRNPEHWAPGCVAVDRDGNQWEAVGGNEHDGATEWKTLQPESN